MSKFKIYNSQDFPDYLPKLNSLYDDLFSGGKGFRSKLVQMASKPYGLNERDVHLLCQTIEFIHNASLLHDDLIDESQLRRGKSAAWKKFGSDYAVLAGDYLLARVMVNLSSRGNIELVQLTAQTISDLVEGEWIQDSLVGDIEVTLGQLDQVHELKTASLFKWCLVAPLVLSGQKNQALADVLTQMGAVLGKCFQRSDDLLDFDIRNEEGKALLGDLKGGYLNSFSAFLLASRSTQDRKRFSALTELNQVHAFFGQDQFESHLQNFDEMNRELIVCYEHLMKTLHTVSDVSFLELEPLARFLYWRDSRRER